MTRALQLLVLLVVAGSSFALGALWHRWQTAAAAVARGVAPLPVSSEPLREPAGTNADPRIELVSIRAEFNPQSALLLGVNELVRFQQQVFKDVVRTVHDRIPVVGFVDNDDELELGQALLQDAGLPLNSVYFVRHPLNSMWLRDFGPVFSRWSDGRVEVVDTIYSNADETGARTKDDALNVYIGRVLNLKVLQMPLVIEGGNLLSNGDGLMVTTTRVMDRPENRHLTREQIGVMLREYLGCRMWVYLRELEGEPTGHIDFCVTFLRRNLAVVGRYDPAYDPKNAAILDEMAATLNNVRTSMGPMQVERVPMPPRTPEGDWRSYCNILLCNGIVLVPSYSDVPPAMEQEVFATFRRLLPNLQVVPIKCDTLVRKRGVLHCIGITIPGYVNVRPLLAEAI